MLFSNAIYSAKFTPAVNLNMFKQRAMANHYGKAMHVCYRQFYSHLKADHTNKWHNSYFCLTVKKLTA